MISIKPETQTANIGGLSSYYTIRKLSANLFQKYDNDIVSFLRDADSDVTSDLRVIESLFYLFPFLKRQIFQQKHFTNEIQMKQYITMLFVLEADEDTMRTVMKKLYAEYGSSFFIECMRFAALHSKAQDFLRLWNRRTLKSVMRELPAPFMDYRFGLTKNEKEDIIQTFSTTKEWIELLFGENPKARITTNRRFNIEMHSLDYYKTVAKTFNTRVEFGSAFWKNTSDEELMEFLETQKNKKSTNVSTLVGDFIIRLYKKVELNTISVDVVDNYLVILYGIRRTVVRRSVQRLNSMNENFGHTLLSYINL